MPPVGMNVSILSVMSRCITTEHFYSDDRGDITTTSSELFYSHPFPEHVGHNVTGFHPSSLITSSKSFAGSFPLSNFDMFEFLKAASSFLTQYIV